MTRRILKPAAEQTTGVNEPCPHTNPAANLNQVLSLAVVGRGFIAEAIDLPPTSTRGKCGRALAAFLHLIGKKNTSAPHAPFPNSLTIVS